MERVRSLSADFQHIVCSTNESRPRKLRDHLQHRKVILDLGFDDQFGHFHGMKKKKTLSKKKKEKKEPVLVSDEKSKKMDVATSTVNCHCLLDLKWSL